MTGTGYPAAEADREFAQGESGQPFADIHITPELCRRMRCFKRQRVSPVTGILCSLHRNERQITEDFPQVSVRGELLSATRVVTWEYVSPLD